MLNESLAFNLALKANSKQIYIHSEILSLLSLSRLTQVLYMEFIIILHAIVGQIIQSVTGAATGVFVLRIHGPSSIFRLLALAA